MEIPETERLLPADPSSVALSPSTLHQAAKDGDAIKIRQIFQVGHLDPNAIDSDGSPPLFGAVRSGCVDSVKTLLGCGASVDVRNPDEDSVLHVAAREDRPHVLSALLEKTRDVQVRNKKRETPIGIAVTRGHLDICDMLCDAGADVDEVMGKNEQSLLHVAISKECVKVAMRLINQGADLSKVDKHGNLALHLAVTLGFQDEELVKLLLNKGEKDHLIVQNKNGNTALHVAARGGHYKAVTLLLDHNAPVDIINKDGDTPLHLVSASGYAVSGGMILKRNKQILNVENNANHLPLHKAVIAGKVNTVKMILKEYATDEDLWNKFLDKENKTNPPCVMDMAVQTGNPKVVSMLIHHTHWKQFMLMEHYSGSGLRCTPMRRLIKEMPDMARLVMDRCWKRHNGDLAAHFDLVDDMYCNWNKIKDDETSSQKSFCPEDGDDVQTYSAGSAPYSQKKSLLKRNHPLKMIADTNAKILMDHPLVKALLRRKWRLAASVYFSFLFYYVTFISLVSSVMLMSEPPFGSSPCSNDTTGNPTETGLTSGLTTATYVFAIFGIVLEILQLFLTRVKHYMELHNILDWFTYAAPIVILSASNACGEFTDWQWQLGVACLFVSYMNILFFLRIVPIMGIYVMMVAMMLQNFMQFFVIMFLFLVSFGFCFYLLLQNQVSFASPPFSVMKSYMMMLGDLDFSGIFLEHIENEDPGAQLHYKVMIWILYIAFLIFMSLVMMNLLTSLAVSGIETLQEDSNYRIMALQINLALDVEFAIPAFLHEKFGCCVKFEKFASPSSQLACMSSVGSYLAKVLYGSLGKQDIIKQAAAILESNSADDELEAVAPLTVKDVENCIVRKTRSLRSEIKQIEKDVGKLTDFSKEMETKMETITQMLQTIIEKNNESI